MKEETGFTLVEVLASLVIITIILTSFMGLFLTTKRLSSTNTEKLVVSNLADAYLARVIAEPGLFIPFPPEAPLNRAEYNPVKSCSRIPEEECPYIHKMNGQAYDISMEFSQNSNEYSRGLLNVSVVVQKEGTSIKSQMKGYLTHDQTD